VTEEEAGGRKDWEDLSTAEKGRVLLLYLLIANTALVVISIVYEVSSGGAIKPAHFGRLAIYGLLAYFTYTGSRVAGTLFGILCGLVAAVIGYAFFGALLNGELRGVLFLGFLTAFTAFSAYAVIWAPPIRAYYSSRRRASAEGDPPAHNSTD
jgi:hypothetical protein